MLNQAEREILKDAVKRAIFCPHCRISMDWKKSVITQHHDRELVLCQKCHDQHMTPRIQKVDYPVSVIDGRKV